VIEHNLLANCVRESGDHGQWNSWDHIPYITDVFDTEPDTLPPLKWRRLPCRFPATPPTPHGNLTHCAKNKRCNVSKMCDPTNKVSPIIISDDARDHRARQEGDLLGRRAGVPEEDVLLSPGVDLYTVRVEILMNAQLMN